MVEQTPNGRGYDTWFGYLNHANDYWNNTLYSKIADCNGPQGRVVDLWNTTKPAYNHNDTGVYEEFLFANEVYKHIDNAANNNPDNKPFFIFYASHIILVIHQMKYHWNIYQYGIMMKMHAVNHHGLYILDLIYQILIIIIVDQLHNHRLIC